jgi:hypothetical protein
MAPAALYRSWQQLGNLVGVEQLLPLRLLLSCVKAAAVGKFVWLQLQRLLPVEFSVCAGLSP